MVMARMTDDWVWLNRELLEREDHLCATVRVLLMEHSDLGAR
jgi:hypothetical protein